MRQISSSQRGDTLVEVILAVAVLSLATVLTMTIVNHSHRALLSAINRESVQTEVDSQAEWMQYFHDMYLKSDDTGSNEYKIWQAIQDRAADGATSNVATCEAGQNAFYIAQDGTNPALYTLQPFANVGQPRRDDGLPAVPGQGLWIDVVENPVQHGNKYIDLMIKACWTAVDSRREEQTSMLVRINLDE